MEALSLDTFRCIITNYYILSPVDVTAVALTCRQFNKWTTSIISAHIIAQGYSGRGSLVGAFKCYCHHVDWKVRMLCDCFTTCNKCYRILPIRLCTYRDHRPQCGFPCQDECYTCGKNISKENSTEFRFIHGILSCWRCWSTPKDKIEYEVTINRQQIRSLFAGVLRCTDTGPIRWELIARYDPDHPLLRYIVF